MYEILVLIKILYLNTYCLWFLLYILIKDHNLNKYKNLFKFNTLNYYYVYLQLYLNALLNNI